MSSASPVQPLLHVEGGITLLGGGVVAAPVLARALALAPRIVAADGGADAALALGHRPELAIGDFDSITEAARRALGPDRLHLVAEQDSTDFDKALRLVAADFVLAVGFAGARLDHTLAAFNVLARYPARRCVMMSEDDVAFIAPVSLTLHLPRGTRVSLFPMGPVRGQSRGLRWDFDGMEFSPAGRVGTSNEVAAPDVQLRFSTPEMLVLLPADCLGAALSALGAGAAR